MTVTTSAQAGGVPAEQGQELVSLTIDGVQLSVPKGTLIIRAAEQLGIAQRGDHAGLELCSRPGSDASPRSPASQFPGGALNSTTSSCCALMRDASSFAWYS